MVQGSVVFDLDSETPSTWRSRLPSTLRWALASAAAPRSSPELRARHRANAAWLLLRTTAVVLGTIHRGRGGLLDREVAKNLARYNAPWGAWLDAVRWLAKALEAPEEDGFEPLIAAFTTEEHLQAIEQAVTIRNRMTHGEGGELPTDRGELDAYAAALVEPLRVASLALRHLGDYRVVASVDEGLVQGEPRMTLRVLFGDEPVEVDAPLEQSVRKGAWLLAPTGRAYRMAPWAVAHHAGRGTHLGVLARVDRNLREAKYNLGDTDQVKPWVQFHDVPTGGVDIQLEEGARRRAFMLNPSTAPTQVGPWRLEGELGRGSSAVVYAVTHVQTDEEAALKLLHPGLTGDESARERLAREVAALRRIQHPGVVRVLQELSVEGQIGFVMERVRGETLRDWIRRRGALSPEATQRLGLEVLGALAAAHASGIVHRDIKPSNIMFDEHQHVRVLDFGVARLTELATITGTVEVVGTRAYLAPEQLRRAACDHRVDLFALGRVLEDCLVDGPVPPGLRAVIRRALQADPQARYADAPSMARALEDPAMFDSGASPISPGDRFGDFVVHEVDRQLSTGLWLGVGARYGLKNASRLGLVCATTETAKQRLIDRVQSLPGLQKAAIGFDGWSHPAGEPVVVAVTHASRERAARVLLGLGVVGSGGGQKSEDDSARDNAPGETPETGVAVRDSSESAEVALVSVPPLEGGFWDGFQHGLNFGDATSGTPKDAEASEEAKVGKELGGCLFAIGQTVGKVLGVGLVLMMLRAFG